MPSNAKLSSGKEIFDSLGVLDNKFTSNSSSNPVENPFDLDRKFTSQSMTNENPSVCPKCHASMSTATITRKTAKPHIKSTVNVKSSETSYSSSYLDSVVKTMSTNKPVESEPVYFCPSCRVTHPMKDVW